MSSLDISNNVVIVKLGGSSITEKGQYETVNDQALKWVAQTLASTTDSEFVFHSNGLSTISRGDTANAKCSFIVVHGAGSFGHMSAKQYGLQGKTVPPSQSDQFRDGCIVQENGSFIQDPDDIRQRTFHGLAKTRAR
jgi:isopentenyl phosphate kinase